MMTQLEWFLRAHPHEVIEAYAEDGSLHGTIMQQMADGLGRMQVAFSAEEQRANAAEVALTKERDEITLEETLHVQHARKQGAADGFQSGWHAALTRLRDGLTVNDLAALVPMPPSTIHDALQQAVDKKWPWGTRDRQA